MAIDRKPQKLFITIDNIAPADALALMKMFKYMERLGNIGSSRFCAFYADGDGSFHPKVSFVYPIELPDLPEITGIDNHGEFRIDSDVIAWRIYHDPEPENEERYYLQHRDTHKFYNVRAGDNGLYIEWCDTIKQTMYFNTLSDAKGEKKTSPYRSELEIKKYVDGKPCEL